MKAIVQDKYGAPADVLRLAEIERPSIKDNEVLVRVRAASVHADVWHSVMGWPASWRLFSGWRRPKCNVPGNDLAGVVESVGAKVTCFHPGDEVFGLTAAAGVAFGNGGAFAEFAAAPESSLVSKPPNVTFEQAASVPASGFIAYANLSRLPADMHGHRALVNGAGGGLGTISLQMLKARGAHVTAVDTPAKFDMLRALGADETTDYTRTTFAAQGVRYDLIFDVASTLTLEEIRPALQPKGLLVWIGHEHYGRAKGGRLLGSGIPQALRLMRKAMFGDPNLPKMELPPVIPKIGEALEALRDLMAQGKLTPAVETYPLESVHAAFRCLEEGRALGKVVLVLWDFANFPDDRSHTANTAASTVEP